MNARTNNQRWSNSARKSRKRQETLRGVESLEKRNLMAGELLEVRLDALRLDGTTAATSLVEGQEFYLRGRARDLRDAPDNQGPFQVYSDIGYTSTEVDPIVTEVQRLTFEGSPVGGTFTLTFNGETTNNISFTANKVNQAAAIQQALEADIPALNGNIRVEVDTSTNPQLPANRYYLRFVDDLRNTDAALLTADGSGLQTDPSDSSATADVNVLPFADGVRSDVDAFRQAFAYNLTAGGSNPSLAVFPDSRQGTDLVDIFDNVGGGAALSPTTGPGLKTYFLVRARAVTGGADGRIEFVNNFSTEAGSEILLFGHNATLTPSDVLFTYGASGTATGSLQINIVPNGIGAVDDSGYVRGEDSPASPLNPSPLANDSHVGAGALSITGVSAGSHGGTLTIINNGANVSYTPAPNFFGTEKFTYTVSNQDGASDDGEITIEVQGVNDAPTFTKGANVVIDEDAGVQIIPNWATNVSPGPGESSQSVFFDIVTNNNQMFETLPTISANGTLQFKTATHASGQAIISVTMRDSGASGNGSVNQSATQTFSIFVQPVNDPPAHAVPGTRTTDGRSAVVFQNTTAIVVFDVDSAASDIVTTLSVSDGRLELGGTVPAGLAVTGDNTATLTLTGTRGEINSAISVLTYRPNSGFTGQDTLRIVTNDNGNTGSGGAKSATDTVLINVTGAAAPDAVDDAATIDEDAGPSTIDVLANDVYHVGSLPVLKAFTQPGNGGTVTRDNNGTPSNLSDDRLVFTPAADFNGQIQFSYSMNDTEGSGSDSIGVVRITVRALNDAPVNTVPGEQSVPEDGQLTIQGADRISVADIDAANLDVVVTLSVGNGTLEAAGTIQSGLQITGNNTPTMVLTGSTAQINAALSQLIYRPNAGFWGTETLTVHSDDQGNSGLGGGRTDTDTVLINVQRNVVPRAVNDRAVMEEDGSPLLIDVLANDVPTQQAQAVLESFTQPASGGTVALDDNGTPNNRTDDKLIFTPAANFHGQVQFDYVMNDTDGTGDDSTGHVTVIVDPTNDPPTAVGNYFPAQEDSTLRIAAPGVLGNDTDIDGDAITAVLVQAPARGTLVLNADGSFTYTPNLNFVGQDTFRYQARDVHGALSVARQVIVDVKPANDPPTAAGNYYAIQEDITSNIAAPGVLGNDSDADGDAITAVLVQAPARGTLTLNANGSFSYTPAANFTGKDLFKYRARDIHGALSVVRDVILDVKPRNDAPTAVPDTYTTSQGVALVVPLNQSVLANDSDVDGDPLRAIRASNPANGTLTFNANGTFTYTPNAGFVGTDSFQYRAADNASPRNAVSALTRVTINVTEGNLPPTAVAKSYSTSEDTNLQVTANDGLLRGSSDPDGNSLTAVIVREPAKGRLIARSSDGSFTYQPNANVNGTDTFTYRVSDGQLSSEVQTVTITIASVNDAPPAVNDTFNVITGVPNQALGDLLANDRRATNPDGAEIITIASFQRATSAGGTITRNANGRFLYTPRAGFIGTDTFSYTVRDAAGGTATATVTLLVHAQPVTQISGFVYRDANNNGRRDAGEAGVGNVEVTLTSKANGAATTRVLSDGTGRYQFTVNSVGTYFIRETQPAYLVDGPESVGSAGGQVSANDRFTLVIPPQGVTNDAAMDYNFGEGGVRLGANPASQPPLQVTLEEILASSTNQGAMLALNGTSRSWFTTLDGSWSSVRNMAVQLSPDGNSLTLTLLVQENHLFATYQAVVGRASTRSMDLRFRTMATNGQGFQIIRLDGTLDLSDFNRVSAMSAGADAVFATL
jgi:hypothetical protein